MIVPIKTVSVYGSPELAVTIECHITEGLPSVIIVGFANRAIDEAKERLRAAFHACKLTFPRKRITINLAPADIPKDGTGFDVGMAAAILQADNRINELPEAIWIGELGLDGDIRPVRGIVGQLLAAKALGHQAFIIPSGNLSQAMLVPGITLLPFHHLTALYEHLIGIHPLSSIQSSADYRHEQLAQEANYDVRIEDIGGHERAKRLLEIAAAGGHNTLLSGPPGTGKSMLAKALASILPPLGHDELLDVTHLHSLATSCFDKIITVRPFRAPHHNASQAAIIGGGPKAKPGEISLAHRGVLFLDELPEYSRNTIEALRQPLEDKHITIARANQHMQYPADFMLVATCNPCPCGFYGATSKTSQPCVCLPYQIMQYQKRLSGPLLDRIDLYSDIEVVDHKRLLEKNAHETSEAVRMRVTKARRVQADRFKTSTKTNALMSNRDISLHAKLDKAARSLLNQAAGSLHLSARGYMRTIKVARTIADLENSTNIATAHVAEALQYRRHSES